MNARQTSSFSRQNPGPEFPWEETVATLLADRSHHINEKCSNSACSSETSGWRSLGVQVGCLPEVLVVGFGKVGHQPLWMSP